MRYLLPLLFVAVGIPLSMAPAHALDTTTQSLVITGYVTSQVTTAPFDRKLVSQARDDACETTLNPGFKWVRWGSIGLPATRRTCTPGAVAHPWS